MAVTYGFGANCASFPGIMGRDVIVDTGFNACLVLPDDCGVSLPKDALTGNVNEMEIKLVPEIVISVERISRIVPFAGVMKRHDPILGIQFLELFQCSLFVQKVNGEPDTVAFLATNDE